MLGLFGGVIYAENEFNKEKQRRVIVNLPCGQQLTTNPISRTNAITTTTMPSDYMPKTHISQEPDGSWYIEVRECR